MSKKKLFFFLKEIGKAYPDSESVQRLVSELKIQLDQLPDPVSATRPETATDSFPVPVEIEGKGDGYFALFSDGGCRGNPGPGAWAAIAQAADGTILFESTGIEFATTNNKMELQGAISALAELITHLGVIQRHPEDDPVHVVVYSDSKYLIDGVTSWIHGWKARGWKKADNKVPENLEFWQTLDTLVARFRHLDWVWVKGHAGHPQNERCDRLANAAMDEAGIH